MEERLYKLALLAHNYHILEFYYEAVLPCSLSLKGYQKHDSTKLKMSKFTWYIFDIKLYLIGKLSDVVRCINHEG